MTAISVTTLTIFSAACGGRPLRFDVDRENLYRGLGIAPDTEGITVSQRDELVGVITGELVDWNAGKPGPARFKLHWVCPQCGQEQWEDWVHDSSEQLLCGSDCQCIDKWLVQWHSSGPTR